MGRDRIPTIADLMRLPAGDRKPRLRSLARYHGALSGAAMARGGPRHAVTRQRNRLAKVYALAFKLGIQGIADAQDY